MGRFGDIAESDDDDHQDEPIPPDLSGEHYQHRRDAMRVLEANQFVCIDKLGSGAFGDVYKMIDYSGREVAVKMVALGVAKPNETEIWPKLSHPNIIPLLEYGYFNDQDVAIFVMPVLRDTLLHAVQDRTFLSQSSALDCIKSWLHGILCGLAYLHSNEVCHLDVKADNVLISHDNKAVICDFSFLASTTKAIPRSELGLPPLYRPPESCLSFGSEAEIEGRAYDMWAYGMMVLELFTNQALLGTSVNAGNWEMDVYPALFNILQGEFFKSSIRGMFSETGISEGQVKLALNFIHTFLMPDRRERWNATKAADHCFFESGSRIGAGPHLKWISFGNPNIEEPRMVSVNRNRGVKREADESVEPLNAKRANTECEKCVIKVSGRKIEELKEKVEEWEHKNVSLERKVRKMKMHLKIDEFAERKTSVPIKIMISNCTQTTSSPKSIAVDDDSPVHISTSNNNTIRDDTFMSWIFLKNNKKMKNLKEARSLRKITRITENLVTCLR
ncbi:serine/threonine-protein kinase dyf-5-like [Parasteatoda tepidariorum]|uniref:serine/threonine-protein kinase dyf-5-like n=1 Tax=Parasteatoda tepidariorum TaxID=114398 RepID=UPI0039BCAA3D